LTSLGSAARRTAKARRSWSVLLLAAAIALVTAESPGGAQATGPAVDGAIEQMKPGEFLWAPEIAPEGPVTLVVSLTSQRAYVYRNGVPIGVSTISSGKPGHDTPTGIFTILQKHADHKSNLYSNAPMPFMQRLTWGGIALHAGNLPGYPASHGCVRLPLTFAKLLYGVTKLGLTVVITNDPVAPEVSSTPITLEPGLTSDRPVGGQYVWKPSRSPTGPLSIVVSGKDKRVVVLRNGIEIGSANITIDGRVEKTEAFTLGTATAGEVRWLRLALPGQKLGELIEMTPGERARAHLPDGFRDRVLSVLQPGSTLLVTRDSLRSSGTGRALTVIVSEPK